MLNFISQIRPYIFRLKFSSVNESNNKSDIKHYSYVDSLRGLAILAVVITHTGQMIHQLPSWILAITSKGAYGVQLFFIVSSLTLFLSYNKRKNIDGVNTNKFFYVRRFFRIVPAFYLAILIYLPVMLAENYYFLGHFSSVNWFNIFVYMIFMGIFYPPSMYYLPFGGWTVEIEMFYYIFIPFLNRIIINLKRALLFFIFTSLFYLTLANLFPRLTPHESLLVFPEQLPVLVLGILSYYLIVHKTNFLEKNSTSIMIISVVYLGLMTFFVDDISFLPSSWLVSFGWVGITLAMAMKKFSILENRLTKFFGKISYSLYLWHFLVVGVVWFLYKKSNYFYGAIDPITSFIILTSVVLIISTIISYLSYKFVEEKGINFGKVLINKKIL